MSVTCPTCSFENPEEALVCQSCMNPLPVSAEAEPELGPGPIAPTIITCNACGAENPPDSRFCGQCGAQLAPAAPPAPPSEEEPTTPALRYKLIHVRTDAEIALPEEKGCIYLGRPGGENPPDIDVTPFPDSSIVSRDHARFIVEPSGEVYIEDYKPSANGTFINYAKRLQPGERYLLKDNDKIMLGLEEKVVFIFQSEG
jgi:hypothetical protein